MGTLHRDGITLTETDTLADTIPSGSLATYAKTDGETWDVKNNVGVVYTALPQQFKNTIRCYALGGIFRANLTGGVQKTLTPGGNQYLRHFAYGSVPALNATEFSYYANLKPGLWLPQVLGTVQGATTPPFSFRVNGVLVDLYNAYNASTTNNLTWTATEFEIEEAGFYELTLRLENDPRISSADRYLTFTELLLRHEDIR